MMQVLRLVLLSVAALSTMWPVGSAQAQLGTGACPGVDRTPRSGSFGPFDYRTNRDKLPGVESYHFTPQVETLIRGQSGSIGGDLSYTLNVFPNHHRALLSAMRFAEREKSPKPSDMSYSIDCYFERALGYAQDDNITRLLYATYLSKTNRKKEALAQIDHAAATAGDNGFSHFNAGLLYFDLNEFDKALRQAHKAGELGMANPALRDRLKTAGKWQEPKPASAAAAPQPEAAASASDQPARP